MDWKEMLSLDVKSCRKEKQGGMQCQMQTKSILYALQFPRRIEIRDILNSLISLFGGNNLKQWTCR